MNLCFYHTNVCVPQRMCLVPRAGLGSQSADPEGAQAGAPEQDRAVHAAAAERQPPPATGEREWDHNHRETVLNLHHPVSSLSALLYVLSTSYVTITTLVMMLCLVDVRKVLLARGFTSVRSS